MRFPDNLNLNNSLDNADKGDPISLRVRKLTQRSMLSEPRFVKKLSYKSIFFINNLLNLTEY